jgi:histidine triad (HIT) family protein
MSDCVFCDIANGEAEAATFYRDSLVCAFMDIRPINPGHVLVVPNEHAAYLAELPEDTGAQMFRIAQRVAAAIRASDLRCQGINFFLADGEAAGQEVFHVHLHVFPRYEGDGFGFAVDDSYYDEPTREDLRESATAIGGELAGGV